MKKELQNFDIHIPTADGGSTDRIVTIQVPMEWDELIHEWVLTEEAHQEIDRVKAREMGLLSPEQLRELRERHGLTQKEIGTLFQVGEKSWCRWESGKHRPSRSINLLIRALYDGELSIAYLRNRAAMKPRTELDWTKYLNQVVTLWVSSHSESLRSTSFSPWIAPSDCPPQRRVNVDVTRRAVMPNRCRTLADNRFTLA